MIRSRSLPRPAIFRTAGALQTVLTGAVFLSLAAATYDPSTALAAQVSSTPPLVSPLPEGTLFSPQQLTGLLPSSVYFQGRTASLQLRNAAGLRFAGADIMWAALVDTSGYASDVQERYEFYLVTEGPLRIGTTLLQAGAYGGGFPGGHFVLMDLGGHTLVQSAAQPLAASIRPRPLQVLTDGPDAARLCLRRQCVTLQARPLSNAGSANVTRP